MSSGNDVLLDGRTFERSCIDVGVGDPILEPVECSPPDLLLMNFTLTLVSLFPAYALDGLQVARNGGGESKLVGHTRATSLPLINHR